MTPFEEYLYYDSLRPGNPADAVTILKFSGRLDAERFQKALQAAISRAPLALCVVEEARDGSLHWKPFPNFRLESLIRYFPYAFEAARLPKEVLDLRYEPGIRFWIYDDLPNEKVTILFQFHHAVTDGVGSFFFLEELFLHYANGMLPPSPSFSLEAMNRWGKVSSDFRLLWRMACQVLRFATGGWWSGRRQPWELREHLQQSSLEVHPAPILTHVMLETTLSRKETTDLCHFCHEHGVTINDWLVTCVFQTFHAYQISEAIFSRSKRSPCRLAVPVNLRKGERQRVTLANLVSVIFVDAYFGESLMPLRRRLPKVAAALRRAKRPENIHLFLMELQGLHDLRWGRQYRDWGMRWFISRRKPLETAVVSNLGVLLSNKSLPRDEEGRLRLRDLCLEDIHLLSPRTTDVALSIAVGTYAGRMKLHFCYDPERIRPSTARFLLSELSRNLCFMEGSTTSR